MAATGCVQEAVALSEGQRAALRRARGCLLSVMAQLMAQRREVCGEVFPPDSPSAFLRFLCLLAAVPSAAGRTGGVHTVASSLCCNLQYTLRLVLQAKSSSIQAGTGSPHQRAVSGQHHCAGTAIDTVWFCVQVVQLLVAGMPSTTDDTTNNIGFDKVPRD